MSAELKIIDETYELMRWVHQHVAKFPRNSRYSLGSRLELKVLDLLDELLTAKFSSQKEPSLQQAGLVNEQIRFLLRLCQDSHLISTKSHQFAVTKLSSIARQIQGWRKHQMAKMGR